MASNAVYDGDEGAYVSNVTHVRFVKVIVSHDDYLPETRTVEYHAAHIKQTFILGKSTDAFAYVGQGRIPYTPDLDTIVIAFHEPVVLAADETAQADSETSTVPADHGGVVSSGRRERPHGISRGGVLNELARDLDISEEKFEAVDNEHGTGRSHLGALRLGKDRGRAGEKQSRQEMLKKLRRNPRVRHAGHPFRRREVVPGKDDEHIAFFTNRIMVRFMPGTTDAESAALLQREGLRWADYCAVMDAVEATADDAAGDEINDIAARLQESNLVLWARVQLHERTEFRLTPGDYLWPALWDRKLVSLEGADGAWQLLHNHFTAQDANQTKGYGDPNIVLTVLDQGVKTSAGVPISSEFTGSVYSGISRALAQAVSTPTNILSFASGQTTVFVPGQLISIGDPADSGSEEAVVKEVHDNHIVLVGNTQLTHVLPKSVYLAGKKFYRSFDFVDIQPHNNNVPLHDNHGIECASVALANVNNDGVVGAAPNVRLLAIRTPIQGKTRALEIEMLLWLAGDDHMRGTGSNYPTLLDRGADIVSLSLTIGGFTLEDESAKALGRVSRRGRLGRGLVGFVAVGNDSKQTSATPTSWVEHGVISGVAASSLNSTGKEIHAHYSNFGQMQFCAPSNRSIASPHNPPSNYGVLSAVNAGTGNLTGAVGFQTQLDSALQAQPGTTLSGDVALNAVELPVSNVTDFLPNRWIRIGILGVNDQYVMEWREIDSVHSTPTKRIVLKTGVSREYKQGTYLVQTSIMTVDSTAGDTAGTFDVDRWVLIGDPGTERSETVMIRRKISATEFEISGPMNAHNPDEPVIGGALDYSSEFGGTSSATPLTAGVAALVLTAKPTLTWVELREILKLTAVKIDLAVLGELKDGTAWGPWRDETGERAIDRNGLFYLDPFLTGSATMIDDLNGITIHGVVTTNYKMPVASSAGFFPGSYVRVGNGSQTGLHPTDYYRVVAVPDAATIQIDNLTSVFSYATPVQRVIQTRINKSGGIGPSATDISVTVDSSTDFSVGDAVMFGSTPSSFETITLPAAFEVRRVTQIVNATTISVNRLGSHQANHTPVAKVGTSLTAAAPTTGSTWQLQVASTAGFRKNSIVIIGDYTGADRDICHVTRIIDATTMEVTAGVNAHAQNTLVIRCRTAHHSDWFGSGRVNAAAAVKMALEYDHDDRDLMIRNHPDDDGVTATDITTHKIHSPDIWVRAVDPIVDKDAALPASYPSSTSYDSLPPHQATGATGSRWIYARIKNRGSAPDMESLHALARFHIYRTNSTDPFVIPQRWRDDLRPDDNITGFTSMANNGAGPFYIGERALYKAPADVNLPALAGGIPSGDHFIVKTMWPESMLPPRDNPSIGQRLRTYVLVEITPQDGLLAGSDIRANNNITSREISFAEVVFRKNSTTLLASSIEVGRSGAGQTEQFEINVKDRIGFFKTEEVSIVMTLNKKGTPAQTIVTFRHSGTWGYVNQQAGITITAPVTQAGQAATGDQFDIRFQGSMVLDKTFQSVEIRVVVRSHQSLILSEISHVITITEKPVHYGRGDIVTSSRPRFHVFAEMAKLTQSEALAFGPKSPSRFRLTSGFTSTEPSVKAFAVVTGTVFVQRIWNGTGYEEGVVNLILKPLRQSKVKFTPVKYFIYRRLKFSDFFELIAGPPPVLRVQHATGISEFLDEFLEQHHERSLQVITTGASIESPPLSNALGWDHATTSPADEYLDRYFFSSGPGFQFPIARRGMSLGHFDTSGEFGFEIVLEEGDFRPKLDFAQAPFYEKTVAGGDTSSAVTHAREEIMNFIDPAAYYGIHYDTGVEDGQEIKKEAALYNDVVARFQTKNTVYVDIRNDNGYSLNYYRNYAVDGQTGFSEPMKIGSQAPYTMSRIYGDHGWPVLLYSKDVETNNNRNDLYIQLRIADNSRPLIYVEHGDSILGDSARTFLKSTDILAGSSDWTKPIGFLMRNIKIADATADKPETKAYVASILKLHYLRQRPAVPADPVPGVVPTTKYLDNLFGPLNVPMFWEPGGADPVTKWVSAQDMRFVDATAPASNPYFAYMAERGVAVQPPQDSGGQPRVIFFASAIEYLDDNVERVRKPAPIIGGFSSRGDLVESSNLFDGLDPKVEIIRHTVGATTVELRIPYLTPEADSTRLPKDVLLLGIVQSQYDALQTLGTTNLSAYHHMHILLDETFSGTDAVSGRAYKQYRLGLRGWKKNPESNGRHLSLDTFPATAMHVYSIDGCFFSSPDFGTLQEVEHYSPNREELVAYERSEPDTLISLDLPMEGIVNAFVPDSIPNNASAKTALESLVKGAAEDILEQARNYAKANYDDRQLYWARLQMAVAFKEHDYLTVDEDFRRILPQYFERYSRGIEGGGGIDFSLVSGKKILVIGFDPYNLSPDINRSNPGGVAALALHGETVPGGGKIQGIVLPIRYADYDAGLIENILPAYISGTGAVHAIVVLGENGSSPYFDIERFAGRGRGGAADNMLEPGSRRIGDGADGLEFYETSLPVASMLPDPFPPDEGQIYFYDQTFQADPPVEDSMLHPAFDDGENDNENDDDIETSGTAIQGSGGSYFFNEVFYRIARLKANTPGSSVQVGLISLPQPASISTTATMSQVVTNLKTLLDRI